MNRVRKGAGRTTGRELYQLIENQHERIDILIDQLIEDCAVRPALSSSARRRFADLDAAIRALFESEEWTLHVLLADRGAGATVERLRAVMYARVLQLLEDLRKLDAGDPAWVRDLHALRDSVSCAFHEEEHDLFTESRKILTHEEAVRAAKELKRELERRGVVATADAPVASDARRASGDGTRGTSAGFASGASSGADA